MKKRRKISFRELDSLSVGEQRQLWGGDDNDSIPPPSLPPYSPVTPVSDTISYSPPPPPYSYSVPVSPRPFTGGPTIQF